MSNVSVDMIMATHMRAKKKSLYVYEKVQNVLQLFVNVQTFVLARMCVAMIMSTLTFDICECSYAHRHDHVAAPRRKAVP